MPLYNDFNYSPIINYLPLRSSSDDDDPHNNCKLLIKSIWNDQSIEVKLMVRPVGGVTTLDAPAPKYYAGVIDMEQLIDKAHTLEIPLQLFLRHTREALCTNDGSPDFDYAITTDGGEFKWRKIQGSIFTNYGTIALTTVDSTHVDFLDDCVEMVTQLRTVYQNSCDDLEKSQAERKEITALYQDCVEENLRIQDVLLNKFTVLVNTKKRRIAELEQLLVEKLVQQINESPEATQALSALADSEDAASSQGASQKRIASDSSQSQEMVLPLNIPKRVRSSGVASTSGEPIAGSSKAAVPEPDDDQKDDDEVTSTANDDGDYNANIPVFDQDTEKWLDDI